MSETAGRWARAYDACTECGTTARKHMGRGLCANCYARVRWHGRLDDHALTNTTHGSQRPDGLAALPCPCGRRACRRGLCRHHYDELRRAERQQANRRLPALALVDPPPVQPPMPAAPAGWSDWQCAGCGTHLRPRHSAGLCVDCVRAAGRLAPDPWEAA